MADPTPIMTALDRAGYRLTEPRRALAALIADQDGHFTAAELVVAARDRRLGIGRATVFRTLEVLAEVGAVERLDLPSGEHAYVGCEPAHHHHVVCSRLRQDDRDRRFRVCGPIVREVARQTGYRVDDHRLELFGLCPACQAARPRPSTHPGLTQPSTVEDRHDRRRRIETRSQSRDRRCSSPSPSLVAACGTGGSSAGSVGRDDAEGRRHDDRLRRHRPQRRRRPRRPSPRSSRPASGRRTTSPSPTTRRSSPAPTSSSRTASGSTTSSTSSSTRPAGHGDAARARRRDPDDQGRRRAEPPLLAGPEPGRDALRAGHRRRPDDARSSRRRDLRGECGGLYDAARGARRREQGRDRDDPGREPQARDLP